MSDLIALHGAVSWAKLICFSEKAFNVQAETLGLVVFREAKYQICFGKEEKSIYVCLKTLAIDKPLPLQFPPSFLQPVSQDLYRDLFWKAVPEKIIFLQSELQTERNAVEKKSSKFCTFHEHYQDCQRVGAVFWLMRVNFVHGLLLDLLCGMLYTEAPAGLH